MVRLGEWGVGVVKAGVIRCVERCVVGERIWSEGVELEIFKDRNKFIGRLLC